MSRDVKTLPKRPFVLAALVALCMAVGLALLNQGHPGQQGSSNNEARPNDDGAGNNQGNGPLPIPRPKPPVPPKHEPPQQQQPTTDNLAMPAGTGGSQVSGGAGAGKSTPNPSEVLLPPSLFSLLLTKTNLLLAALLIALGIVATFGRSLRKFGRPGK